MIKIFLVCFPLSIVNCSKWNSTPRSIHHDCLGWFGQWSKNWDALLVTVATRSTCHARRREMEANPWPSHHIWILLDLSHPFCQRVGFPPKSWPSLYLLSSHCTKRHKSVVLYGSDAIRTARSYRLCYRRKHLRFWCRASVQEYSSTLGRQWNVNHLVVFI